MRSAGWIALASFGLGAVLFANADATAQDKNKEAITTKSGLKYIEEKIGEGEPAKVGQTVWVHYTGKLKDGTKFDSSFDHPGMAPLEFQLGTPRIIKGWNEGIAGMKVGGKRKLIIPPALAYGDKAKGKLIPPNSELHFDVELVKVK